MSSCVHRPNHDRETARSALSIPLVLICAVALSSCGDTAGPKWSNDRLPGDGELLFISDRSTTDGHLFVMDSGGVRSLPRLPGEEHVRDARWSHDGEMIAYSVRRWYGDTLCGYDIYVLGDQEFEGWPLVTSQGSDREPRWSPDDTKIAFLSDREHPGPGLYVINGDGSEEDRLLAGEFPDDWGAWSPDGASLVVAATGGEPMRIVGVAAKDTTKLVTGYAPQFAPDGGWIAYHNRGIHLIKPDKSEERTLTQSGDAFRWSPQGDYISFRDSNPYTPYTLEVVAVEDTTHLVLAEYQESWRYIRYHAWSPGGDYIAYQSALNLENTESAIFVASLETGGVWQVTHYPGPNRRPEWRPE